MEYKDGNIETIDMNWRMQVGKLNLKIKNALVSLRLTLVTNIQHFCFQF